jgi:serine/threonine-protein kinase
VEERTDDLLEGTPFRAVARIGRGGMGEVYLAQHRELGREMVVKLLLPELSNVPELVERLQLEARALGALNHPNIVSVFNAGRTRSGQPYLAMERLCGRTLAQELHVDGKPRLARALSDIHQVLAGLGAAHEVGLVHRDLKPNNVFVHTHPPRMRQLKLLDFGVVKVLDSSSRELPKMANPTAPGTAIGTPRFMSPEQAQGKPVDARSDLYAAGLLLYQLVAGRGPWDEIQSQGRVLAAQIRD